MGEGHFALLVEPPAEAPHRCSPPDPSVSSAIRRPKFDIGTIWICECGRGWRLWRMREVMSYGSYVCNWRPYPRWYDRMLTTTFGPLA